MQTTTFISIFRCHHLTSIGSHRTVLVSCDSIEIKNCMILPRYGLSEIHNGACNKQSARLMYSKLVKVPPPQSQPQSSSRHRFIRPVYPFIRAATSTYTHNSSDSCAMCDDLSHFHTERVTETNMCIGCTLYFVWVHRKICPQRRWWRWRQPEQRQPQNSSQQK